MQAGQIVTVDASTTQPIEISKDDPRHAKNLSTSVTKLNSQAAADTKYDPKPPPRVDANGKEVMEQFIAPIDATDIQLIAEFLYGFGALSAIILVMAVFCFIDPAVYNVVSKVRYGKEMVVGAVLISILNMTMVYYSLKRNEIIQWYPALTR